MTEVFVLSGAESTDHDRDGLLAQFAAAVSSLADGELTFPPPYDLSSSAALADNIDAGDVAQWLFDVTALRDTGYTVRICASSEHPEIADREVINTRVSGTRVLVALLEGLLSELDARQERESQQESALKGNPLGGQADNRKDL